MLRQMSELLDFDGTLARIAIKQAWYEKGKSDLPIITSAFQQTFQSDIQVTLEKAASSSGTTARRNSPPQDSTRVQQPPTTTIYQQPAPAPAPAPQPVVTNTPPVENPTPQPNPAPTSQPVSEPVSQTPISQAPVSEPVSQAPVSQAPVSAWDHEQVNKAAKSLANFFSGEIINLIDDSIDLSDSGISPDIEIYEVDYDYD
jgi:DNA polymerase-3 subunit gamma/tau